MKLLTRRQQGVVPTLAGRVGFEMRERCWRVQRPWKGGGSRFGSRSSGQVRVFTSESAIAEFLANDAFANWMP